MMKGSVQGCSMKEQTNSFFRRALYKENNENIISVFSVLYFYIKSGDMVHTLSTIWDYKQDALLKKTLIV